MQYYQEWPIAKVTTRSGYLLKEPVPRWTCWGTLLQDEASLLFTLHKIWIDFVEHPISVLSDVISY